VLSDEDVARIAKAIGEQLRPWLKMPRKRARTRKDVISKGRLIIPVRLELVAAACARAFQTTVALMQSMTKERSTAYARMLFRALVADHGGASMNQLNAELGCSHHGITWSLERVQALIALDDHWAKKFQRGWADGKALLGVTGGKVTSDKEGKV
jgi:hypothetical protein